MSQQTRSGCTRRTLIKAGTGAVAGLAVTAAGDSVAAQSEPYGGYLSDANNFDGTTVDATGQDEVTVAVGAGNGLAFGPAAVQVDPGTTVVWEWTGQGGAHNVVAEDGSFDSGETVVEPEEPFEHTFEEEGAYRYYCDPHRLAGMKGVIAVGGAAENVATPGSGNGGGSDGGSSDGGSGDGSGDGDSGSGGDGGEGGDGGDEEATAANPLAARTLLAMLALGFLSPIVFLLLVRRRMGGTPSQP